MNMIFYTDMNKFTYGKIPINPMVMSRVDVLEYDSICLVTKLKFENEKTLNDSIRQSMTFIRHRTAFNKIYVGDLGKNNIANH